MCVCMHACMSLDSIPIIRITLQVMALLQENSWPKMNLGSVFRYILVLTYDTRQNVFVLKYGYVENTQSNAFVFSLFTGSL